MRPLFKITLLLFLFTVVASGQNTDTLKVLILSPKKIEVSENYNTEFNKHKEEVLLNRYNIKKQKENEKNEHIEEYNRALDYKKKMIQNEIDFYDHLTIENYISLVFREYIEYRLFRPFKIKTRLILVTSLQSESDLIEYKKISNNNKNLYIINFPLIKVYKENNELKVLTKTELYSSKTNEIIYSKENIGIAKSGLTDYPMCLNDNWDCAYVNSAYPSIMEIVFMLNDKYKNNK